MERRRKDGARKRLRRVLCCFLVMCVMTPAGVVRAAEIAEAVDLPVETTGIPADAVDLPAEGALIEAIPEAFEPQAIPETPEEEPLFDAEVPADGAAICIPEEITEGSVSYAAAGTVPLTLNVQYLQTDARKSLAAINAFRSGSEAWYLDVGEPVGGKRVSVKGLSRLEYDYDLEKAAMLRAVECLIKFSHTRPDGNSFSSAVSNRYDFNWVGENLFYANWNSRIPDAVFAVEAWKEKDCDYEGQGHRRNMLEDRYTHVGVAGVHYGGMTVWVQEFGSRTKGASARTAAADDKKDMTIRVPEDLFELSVSATEEAARPVKITTGQSVSVSPGGVTLNIKTVTVKSHPKYVEPVSASCRYQYSVTDPSVASCSGQTVTGIKAGESVLQETVSWNGLSRTSDRKIVVSGQPAAAAGTGEQQDTRLSPPATETPAQKPAQNPAQKQTAKTWKKDRNGKYWYDLGNGRYPAGEWLRISGKWYYFDKSGYMVTGWQKVNKKWYYLGSNGAMVTGWKKVSGKWYYMDKKSGAMKTGWVKSGGKWYYMNGSGQMLANTSKKIGGKTYRFNKSGRCTNP